MGTARTANLVMSRRHALALASGLGVAIANLKLDPVFAQATPPAMDLSMYPELTVTTTDETITLSTDTMPSGLVLLTFDSQVSAGNTGGGGIVGPPAGMNMSDFSQQVQTQATPEGGGLPPIAYQAVILGGPGNIDPGMTGQAIINLPAGDWMVGAEGNQPFVPLTATAGTSGTIAEPDAGVTITEIDFSFAGFDNVPAGPQIWKVVNTGTQPHMLVLLGVPAGTTIDQVMGLIMAPENATPTPGGLDPSAFQDRGGVFLQSAGTTVWPVLDLPAGRYVALCFVGDPNKGGEPHAMEGMVSIFDAA